MSENMKKLITIIYNNYIIKNVNLWIIYTIHTIFQGQNVFCALKPSTPST